MAVGDHFVFRPTLVIVIGGGNGVFAGVVGGCDTLLGVDVPFSCTTTGTSVVKSGVLAHRP